MKRIMMVLPVVLALFSQCKDSEKKEAATEGFVIEGNIAGSNGTVVRLGKVTQGTLLILDTDTTDVEGNFKLEGYEREKFLAIINYDISGRVFLVVDSTSHIKVNIPEDRDKYTVEGSEESKELREIRDVEVKYGKELTGLREKYSNTAEGDEAGRDSLQKIYEKLIEQSNGENLQRVMQSEHVMVQLFGYYILQLNFDDSTSKIVYENAVGSGLQNEIVSTFIGEYKKKMATNIGELAPEIALQDTVGNVIALSSLRGKVVLLDFWAAWCGPCRKENPNVLRIYNEYKDQGFEIFGISLDDTKEAWIKAIHEDGIPWIHVSDLQKWNSSAARLYAVSSIPATFLLDREGKIIAKDLRGEDLEKKVKEVLEGGNSNGKGQ